MGIGRVGGRVTGGGLVSRLGSVVEAGGLVG